MIEALTKLEQRQIERDFAFFAFLAALRSVGLGQITATSDVLHESFGAALETLRSDERTSDLFGDYYSSPITGRFDQLDQALIHAEQYGLIQFPNPSYTKVRIALSPLDAERLLQRFGQAKEPLELAAARFKTAYMQHAW